MPRSPSVRPDTTHVYTHEKVNRQIRESLGLPPKPETQPTVPVEGHVCDFPLWSYSRRRSSVTRLHIDYDDDSFVTLKAPEGMPSPSFPGYLDVLLFFGQRDLFEQEYIEMSVYRILGAVPLSRETGSSPWEEGRDTKVVLRDSRYGL